MRNKTDRRNRIVGYTPRIRFYADGGNDLAALFYRARRTVTRVARSKQSASKGVVADRSPTTRAGGTVVFGTPFQPTRRRCDAGQSSSADEWKKKKTKNVLREHFPDRVRAASIT